MKKEQPSGCSFCVKLLDKREFDNKKTGVVAHLNNVLIT